MNIHKLAISFLVAITFGNALAEEPPVSKSLMKSLKYFRVDGVALVGGVLRVRMADQVVTPDVFNTVAHLGVCADQWQQPDSFAAMKIQKVEIVNAIEAQGFAFLDATATCKRVGKMKGEDADELFAAQTVRCEAGVCRRR